MFLLIRCLIIAALLKFSYSLTRNPEGKVSGRVLVLHEKPLKNILVTLASDSLVVRMSRTNENGYFTFNKLPKGNYRIIIVITGYEKYTTDFFSLTAAKPIRAIGDIELRTSKQTIPFLLLKVMPQTWQHSLL
ncbi:carboxypeptidase-like regulatory domain-containing protein [Pedobacter sp. Du54]|uniref:carboxypeptidase-like regulatory domain-containing protein n=1 Tax=Pedobacter anseongensis TaxID=3133439 RepID=UPI00309EF7AC